MALETATTANDLVATNPENSDGVAQGDDHIRLLKSVLKTMFPDDDLQIFRRMTQAEYDALASKDDSTLYVVPTS